MTELLSKPEQGQEALLTEREVLEGYSKDQLLTFILDSGAKVSDIERLMNLASDVLEGVYGTSVEEELGKQKDGNQT